MIENLRQHIQNALREVTTQNALKVYNAIQSELGYKNMEDRIIQMMIAANMTASACIFPIET